MKNTKSFLGLAALVLAIVSMVLTGCPDPNGETVAFPPLDPATIADPVALAAYINANCADGTEDAPKILPFTGAITADDLVKVRDAINKIFAGVGAYIIWDLSAVTGGLTAVQIGGTLNVNSYDKDKIKGLILPVGLKTIGPSAFSLCTGLDSIELPTGLETIDDNAFQSCVDLKSITLPTSLTSIGNLAFDACTSLESITLPAGLKTIGNSTFSSCITLKSVTVREGLETIGTEVFAACGSLESVTLPASLKTIGDGTFAVCTSLKSITLPAGLTSIGDQAFFNCILLETVVFEGTGVTIADANSFPYDKGGGISLEIAYETGAMEGNKGVAGTYTRTPATAATDGSWSRD
jgi:hypothetical protein